MSIFAIYRSGGYKGGGKGDSKGDNVPSPSLNHPQIGTNNAPLQRRPCARARARTRTLRQWPRVARVRQSERILGHVTMAVVRAASVT